MNARVIELNEMELDSIVGGNIFEDAWDWISGDAWDWITDKAGQLWDNFVEGFWEKGLKEMFYTGPKKIIDRIKYLIDTIGK